MATVFLGRFSVSDRFLLVLATGLMIQIGISGLSLVKIRQSLVEDRISEVKHLVDAAYSTIKFYHDQASSGLITDDAARRVAADAVRAMHYDGGNYFFIWDLNGTSVAHGAQPALEGRTFIDAPDALVNPVVGYMVRQLVDVAKSPAKEGVTSYQIPKAGQFKPLPKIAYSRLFEPWGWSVGTGAYTDDIEDAFLTQALAGGTLLAVLAALAWGVCWLIGRDMVRTLNHLSGRVAEIAHGQLDGSIPGVERGDEIGVIARALLVLRDTSREAAELRLDHLTGLPTRKLMMDRLWQIKAHSARNGSWCALLLIDMDRFKFLNDTHGHDVGDLMLCEVARRLSSSVREGDTVARLGGDEFVVLLADVGHTLDQACQTAEQLCRSLAGVLSTTYHLGSIVHDARASIGITLFAGEACSAEVLLKQADLAMYRSKEAGDGCCRFFDPHMERSAGARRAESSGQRQPTSVPAA